MNKYTRLFFALLLATLFHFFAGQASACSCRFGGGAPCEEYWRVDAVFAGRVVGASEITVDEGAYKSQMRAIRLAVEQAFRGGVEEVETEVITGTGGGDCGYGFKMGERYMVYAYRGEKDHKLYTSICSRTRPLAKAAEDLDFFRELAGTRDPSGSVFGRVVKRNYQWKEGENVFLPVTNVDVTIEGAEKKYETRTDAQGRFRVGRLPPGAYKAKLKVPEGLTDERLKDEGSRVLESEVKVMAHGCAETEFYLDSDTRVAGRVVDATAQPVAGLKVEMRPAPNNRNNYSSLLYAQTDAEGRFEFKVVPPGDYILGFRIIGSSTEDPLPYARVYYPGVTTRAQAGVVSVKEGERVRGLELRLMPRLEEVNLEGVVVWPDGRPVPEAGVTVSLFEEGEMTTYKSLKTDERGRFSLKVLSGATYRASAALSLASGGYVQSKWTEFQAAPGAEPLKIVLEAEPRKPAGR
jgi:5-hydroxyisourate hydrolase-like protein (transthyretin family)